MVNVVKERGKRNAQIISAAERVELRRWLRRNVGYSAVHGINVFDKLELMKLVDQHGGDSCGIVLKARNHAIDCLLKRKGYEYNKMDNNV